MPGQAPVIADAREIGKIGADTGFWGKAMTDLAVPPPVQPHVLTPTPPGFLARVGRALRPIGSGAAKLIGRGRDELAEGLSAAGASIERAHQRLAIGIVALVLLLVAGAAFRSLGWPEANYALIAIVGLGALYAVSSPAHLAGVLLVGGGVTAWKGGGAARDTLLAYARLIGRLLLALIIPLLIFAIAPGDRSLATSLKLLALAPVVLLAVWLFGRIAPRVEKWLFVGVPAAALTVALANMLIPERTLATIGVPAWLRASRPQDDELARIELALEQRRNEARAASLRTIRAKIEAGEPLTAEDEAAIAAAQADRVTLTGWVGKQYDAVQAEVRRRAATPGGKDKPLVVPPVGGTVSARTGDWSSAVTIPAGQRLCTVSPAGEAAYITECAMGDGAWKRRAAGGCEPGKVDRARFRGRGGAREVKYSFVPVAGTCPAN